MRQAAFLAGLCFGLLAGAAGASEPQPASLRERMETLFMLQDDAARGADGATEGQRSLLMELAAQHEQLLKAAAATRQNASLMLAYVLSGGQPSLAEAFARSEGLDPHCVLMLETAALFMRGKGAEAAVKLEQLDTDFLAVPDRARVALMKAVVLPDSDPRKMVYFRQVIAAAPGSLLEEAALRRAALSAAAVGDTRSMTDLAERYVRRFPSSSYAPDFFNGYIKSLVALAAGGADVQTDRIQAALDRVPQARRRSTYVMLARSALRERQLALFQFAADQAMGLSQPGSQEFRESELLNLSAALVTPRWAPAASRLSGLNKNSFAGESQLLFRAALAVAIEIGQPAAGAGGTLPNNEQLPAVTVMKSKVEADLRLADALLSKAREE